MITRENYESYYLDYIEGNLNEADMVQFLDFLKTHPDLVLADDFEAPILQPSEQKQAFDKTALFQFDDLSITPENEESWMIANAEKILKPAEIEVFNEYIKGNEMREKETFLFTQSRLIPEISVFERKKELYKEVRFIPSMWISRAAAAVLIGGLSYYLYNANSETTTVEQNTPIAQHKKSAVQPKNNAVIIPSHSEIKPKQVLDKPTQKVKDYQKLDEIGASVDTPIELAFKRLDVEQKGVKPLSIQQVRPTWDLEEENLAQIDTKPNMTKPYEGIASLLSDATGRTIDFQRTDAKNCEKGFKFQVGNFEIGRRTTCK